MTDSTEKTKIRNARNGKIADQKTFSDRLKS